jgi:hypothetical protein
LGLTPYGQQLHISNNLDHHDCAKPTKWSAPK